MNKSTNDLALRADAILASFLQATNASDRAASADQLLAVLADATDLARHLVRLSGVDVTCPLAFADHAPLAQAWADGLGAAPPAVPHALAAAVAAARGHGLHIQKVQRDPAAQRQLLEDLAGTGPTSA